MEISLISLLAMLGGVAGVATLIIQIGKLVGWWASAPVDGKVTHPDDNFPIAAAVLRSLQDGNISAEEAAQVIALLGSLKSAKKE